MWFSEVYSHGIGRIAMDGTITHFYAGFQNSVMPFRLVTGPDGNLWF